MKNLILKTLAGLSFTYLVLFVLSLDSLTMSQLIKGSVIGILPTLYLVVFIFVNYGDDLYE